MTSNLILMKKTVTLFLVAVLFTGHLLAGSETGRAFRLAKNITPDDYWHGKIIFKIKPEYRSACGRTLIGIPSLNERFLMLQVEEVAKRFPNHQPPAQERNARGKLADISLIYQLKYNASIGIEKAINILLQEESIEFAEPDYVVRLCYLPNDTLIPSQYQLVNIRAFQGWDVAQGDTNIVIGITDTGTDMDHPDLVNQIKHNYGDPVNGIDDDADGYADNFSGWDLGDNDNNPNIDAIVHGSFVSGCSSAQTDNVTGITGSGFKCMYLPIKISSGNFLTNAYDGIIYAADHGCHIINASWGSVGGGTFGQIIIDYATINQGKLVVAAAGNNNNDDAFYPASYKYVFSVTGTNTTDAKWANSSYGCNVDISAPGEAVYSTISNDTYAPSSGTSFSSPIVAGLAGIVMAHFDTLTPLQVAEQLRITSDDIDTVPANAPYQHELGKGRVNLYRALTETSAQSVRMSDINITDNNDNAFAANDTLRITGLITNWLNPVSNLVLTLTANSPDVTILDGTVNIASMATFDDTDNNSDPFTVIINPTIPFNTEVMFTINYSATGGYSDFQCFDDVLNVDYINVTINDIGTSITSRGRIGYNAPNQSQGLGFTYNDGPSFLFESSLLIADTSTRVSDQMFGAPVTVNDTDFTAIDYVREVVPTIVSHFDLYSTFNDDGAAANKLNVTVTQNTYAWSTPADAKYIMIYYTYKNDGSTALNDFYAGIYADWDIGAVTNNRAAQNASLKLGYAWENIAGGIYAGVKVLGSAPFNCYAVDNNGAGGSINIYDGFTKAEKYTSMSTSRASAGQGDVSLMVSSGPYTIAAGDSIRVGFALLAGDNLATIQAAAAAADIKFSLITSVDENNSDNFSWNVFPNPVRDNTAINLSLYQNENVKIELTDITGKSVLILKDGKLPAGKNVINLNSKNLRSGIYFIKMTTRDKEETKKLIITR
jgi:serine protease